MVRRPTRPSCPASSRSDCNENAGPRSKSPHLANPARLVAAAEPTPSLVSILIRVMAGLSGVASFAVKPFEKPGNPGFSTWWPRFGTARQSPPVGTDVYHPRDDEERFDDHGAVEPGDRPGADQDPG